MLFLKQQYCFLVMSNGCQRGKFIKINFLPVLMGWVGSGRVGSGRVGSGRHRVGSGGVGEGRGGAGRGGAGQVVFSLQVYQNRLHVMLLQRYCLN